MDRGARAAAVLYEVGVGVPLRPEVLVVQQHVPCAAMEDDKRGGVVMAVERITSFLPS